MSARRRTRTIGALLPILLVAACGGPAPGEPDDAVTAKLPPTTTSEQATALGPFPTANSSEPPAGNIATQEPPAADPDAAQPPTLADSGYTSLEPAACTPIADSGQGAAALRHRCKGPRDYALETSESGQRQDLAVIAPDGQRAELDVAEQLTNARLGKTAEWRRDGSGRPRALIVRVNAAPDGQAKGVSNLVVSRLAAPACIVAVIPRGPGQNEKARAIADAERLDCMKE